MQDRYGLPADYQTNPAATFDAEQGNYWDPARVDSSLAYQAKFYRWVLSEVLERGLKTVADVGCGTAAKLARLHRHAPGVQTCGIDQPNAIALCQANYDFGEWLGCDLETPETLPARKFDLIVASDVIEHLENPNSLLRTMRKVAHKESLLMLSTPDREVLRGKQARQPANPYHVREWNRAEFAGYLASQGLEIIQHRLLPAFDPTHSWSFYRRAMRRWLRLRSIRYNQGVLARFHTDA